jgi:hypothetical protein
MKGEYLMMVPETADGFRATISALWSLGKGEGVSFHTFSLPEHRCVRLLLKNLFKRMPETEIRQKLKVLHIQLQAVSCNSDRGDRTRKPRSTVPSHLTSSCR